MPGEVHRQPYPDHVLECHALALDCNHEGKGRIKKYDGGRRPLLCGGCYEIVGWW